VKRLGVAVSGLSVGALAAVASSMFAPGCGLDCGEHPIDPRLGEYVVIESTHDWLLGARVTVSRGRYEGTFGLTISVDGPEGAYDIHYQYF
jgi:hypothetical protein